MNKFPKFFFSFLVIVSISSSQISFSQMYWDQAASFPGTSGSHIAVPSDVSMNLPNGFTLEAWINPSVVSFIGKGIISKGTGLNIRYALRILSGRITLMTNATQRLISTSSHPIPLNTWTHIAATLSPAGLYQIYINGLPDTSVSLPGTGPAANTDSLYIGSSGSSTEFSGLIDEVRIWDTNLSNIQIRAFMKSSIALSGDFLSNNLVLSIPFQNNTGAGTLFSAMDHSGRSNNGYIRNVSALDLKDRPSFKTLPYDCLNFSGTGFVTAFDSPALSPGPKLTLECWIYPKSDNYGLLYKGNFISANPNYGLSVISGKLNAYINNIQITSNDSVKKDRWSHIAFTYFGATGGYDFYINGKKGSTGNITPGNITDGPDSLIIGAFPSTTNFSGFMDELRIISDVKSINEINNTMFSSINESNDNDASLNAVYNLDASTLSNTDGNPRLNLRGSASFNFNSSLIFSAAYQSPVNNLSNGQFHSGYLMNMPQKRIPSSGISGTAKDTIEILSSDVISDMNIFTDINHLDTRKLRLTITGPTGASVEFFSNTALSDSNNNIVTVFDSDADSSLINGRYVAFGPKIRPQIDLDAVYSGSNSKGKWILTVADDGGSDTGILVSWGIQINNNTFIPSNLECTSLIEGYYNSVSNSQFPDTVRYFLRSAILPYSIIDSSRSKVNSSGTALVPFTKAQQLTNYFLVLKHRNSIETWSSSVIKFAQFTKQAQYNFTDQQSKAFGNNMKQVDTSPVEFAIYSGDIDHNGFVDLNDITMAFNDASSFLAGYNITDVTGDNLTDLSDVLIVFNNSSAFVASIVP